ncbi:preprotein translocase subunit SecG [Entomospira entomophila]|uniref:Protein-export membrane protein SecG n=1 Tax=Entomospira entomophila TaxID=2719988 RepID=A0A968G8U9_9SPIO|nr:preprotein translocase subunit SecG [Entomospira entomophilus]NIZ40692.1 preprotein translocase subunit SecG [Entomospira entomophilus]WDI34905.1 preprotein translocase subunit SecG [Entomospira entomophilus]
MGIISNLLLGLFVFSAILLILLVIIQDDQGDSIGGLFAGSSSPFRSRSGNILQHITSAVAIFFFVSALGYALLMKPRDPLGNLSLPSEEGVFLEQVLDSNEEKEPQEPNAPSGFDLNFNQEKSGDGAIGFGSIAD